MAGNEPRRFGRRAFLRGVGAAGATAAVLGAGPGVAEASTDTRMVKVYRLSTRGMAVCNACKSHAAHRYIRKYRFAVHSAFRAHKHCNCRVLLQRIPKQTWNQYFRNADGSLRREWDDRW
jgi:hypothetical protein